MSGPILGIDLGTSAVKLLLWTVQGAPIRIREPYDGAGCEGWWKALQRALAQADLSQVQAIGLSAQVGTYIVDEQTVLPWDDPAGREELRELKGSFPVDTFLREIAMPHPDLISYPVPRLRYIGKRFPACSTVCQPKDWLCERLTGNRVSDPYSWRGLANPHTGRYSELFLRYTGVDEDRLPPLIRPTEEAGRTTGTLTGLPKGIPVYVGCNDFYASLFGMGIGNVGDLFDITGTSEHVGVVTREMRRDTPLVCSPYIVGNVHYGVTASSGSSMAFARRTFPGDVDLWQCLNNRPPVFLPYLNGERAPIWDPHARGVFFGIHQDCTGHDMAYAVMEGVVFSLYHIFEGLAPAAATSMVTSGGNAGNAALNALKAELFGLPVVTLRESETSALGAVMLAAVGSGRSAGLPDAMGRLHSAQSTIEPVGRYRDILLERFERYKQLYPSLKEQFRDDRRPS